ncbi:MAG: hypothetical protein NVS3B10_31730 [Polyangiales bacterium]
MAPVFVTLSLGAAIGVVGAVPPGPLGVALIYRRSEAHGRDWRELGGGLLHLVICIALALAVSPLIASFFTTPWAKLGLCMACSAFGLAEILRVRASLFAGPLESVALPSRILVLKWVLILGVVICTKGPAPNVVVGLAFVAGVWLGVASWFAGLLLLANPVERAGANVLARRTILAGGGLIMLLGLSSAMHAFAPP